MTSNQPDTAFTIVHFTTVHDRDDTRIRLKEVVSLAEVFNEPVGLFVQDGRGNEVGRRDRITVIDTATGRQGRWARMILGGWRMYRAVRAAGPTVAHFHDPELIPVGLALKLSGLKVIYDVHENVPQQILSKAWIAPSLRKVIARIAGAFEWVAGRAFDGVVAATPSIARRFPSSKTVTVQNFPILSELVPLEGLPYDDRLLHFGYVGVINRIRGAVEMVDAIGRVSVPGARLQLAGKLSTRQDEEAVQELRGWSRVFFRGWANRSEVAALLGHVRAGLVLFHPLPNHLDAQPNKMFEYMAAGLPVIVSDFPLWRKIVEHSDCGLLVDPLEPEQIADAMRWVLENPKEAERMGRQGQAAVEEKFNWDCEARELVGLYARFLG